jgi:23S rRNA (guanosine2251-2'-O)-methyltransferase
MKKNSLFEAYWLYGRHSAIAALKNPNRKIRNILVSSDFASKHASELSGHTYHTVSEGKIAGKLQADSVHQGVALEVLPLLPPSLDAVAKKFSKIAILDQVTDPHNVGAILRSAAAFGIEAVINTLDHGCPENNTLAKTSASALEVVPYIQVVNIASTIRLLKANDFFIVGLDMGGTLLNQIPKHDKIAIVLGSEGKGMRRLTTDSCDAIASIPISNKIESLNVSNAAAVTFYHFS